METLEGTATDHETRITTVESDVMGKIITMSSKVNLKKEPFGQIR